MVRGVVMLLAGEREVGRWPLELPGDTGDAGDAVDIGAVDYLAALQLRARRFGCEVRFTRLCPRVRELLDLAGLGDWVEMER